MIDREDLESLSSAQLHDRAIGSAKAGGDIDWLWHVLGSMPAAEGTIGDLEDSGMDVAATVSAINGYLRADPDLADALRPQYVDYLLEQHWTGTSGTASSEATAGRGTRTNRPKS